MPTMCRGLREHTAQPPCGVHCEPATASCTPLIRGHAVLPSRCAFPEKRLGWVVVAEGDVTLCSMQKDTFLTSVPRDMFLAIRAESTFCHDFYQGAFNSTTSKAKARSLKEQQDALAAERE